MALTIKPGEGTEIPFLPAPGRILPAPGRGRSTKHALNIKYISQSPGENWCWVACSLMLIRHLGKDATKCSLASLKAGIDCCPQDTEIVEPGECDKPDWPHNNVFPEFDIKYKKIGDKDNRGILSFDAIKSEIDSRKMPIMAYYNYGNSGHIVLVTGYYDDGSLVVLNPDPKVGAEAKMSYDYLKAAEKPNTRCKWWVTYFDFSI